MVIYLINRIQGQVVQNNNTIEILPLKESKFVLLETDPVYLFNSTKFLYHITNISKLLGPVPDHVEVVKLNEEEKYLINKIEHSIEQLETHHKTKRSLDFIGTAVKFITGNPDAYDLREIKTVLNNIIENNNKQVIINEHFEELFKNIRSYTNHRVLILRETLEQINNLLETINFAKKGTFVSKSIDIKDIREIVKNEKINVPVINILEYSEIHMLKYQDLYVTVFKYPIISHKCKFFKVVPLEFRHGKLVLDSNIAQCKNFLRVKKCKEFLNSNICKLVKIKDNCTTNVLENEESNCKVIQEQNEQVRQYTDDSIIVSGSNKINNETVFGTHLIKISKSVIINDIEYRNEKETILQYAKNKNQDNIYINEILESESKLKFNNIKSLKKFILPLEQHPILYTFYTIILISIIMFSVSIYSKIQKRISEKRAVQNQAEYFKILNRFGINNSEDTIF